MNTMLLPRNESGARRAPRMAELAVLPIFLNLKGRKAILAGGSDAAAWKAELLAASSATVHIFAERLDPMMQALVDGPGRKSYIHHCRPWTPDCLAGAAIAIADARTDAEARAFFRAAKSAGVPANVIDKPDFCDFQFGSIVNRSPVVIGISTGGGAPILAQAIRRRVETLLPASLRDWVRLAARIRPRAGALLKPGAPRRLFWEGFVDRAFGEAPDADAEIRLLGEAEKIGANAEAARGRVILIGTGPGDAELLTVKAVRALQTADVIFYEDGISDDVLELARREAERRPAAKADRRAGGHDPDLAAILALTRTGKIVARLYRGDPSESGHAAATISRLRSEDVAVSTIAGIRHRPAVPRRAQPARAATLKSRPCPGGFEAVHSVP